MNYIIKRTSVYHDKPCEEAFEAMHEHWHVRTVDEKTFDDRFSNREGLWRSKGKNHSLTEEGYIIRQEDDVKVWTISINNLEELNSFSKKYGSLIISHSRKGSPELEIYDDYRE